MDIKKSFFGMPKKDVKYFSIASPRQESLRFYRNLLSLVNDRIISCSFLYVKSFSDFFTELSCIRKNHVSVSNEKLSHTRSFLNSYQ